ncbi:hypothetical protein AVEN_183042-1 [Araneus ventricosus]|uniref:Uncharacterized protein n=1 Tax=Araneus ventricosus TaxID=182803 RepID=A0A4Y2F120_ARAVE|nr:hypothetical protein AVEN_183042-1 [Araneus ventricosus]
MDAQLYPRIQVRLNDVEASQLTRNEKIQSVALHREVILTVFWDVKGIILIDFFTSGAINAASYCDTVTNLKSTNPRKRPRLLSRGVLFLGDNVRPSTARDTKEHIRRLRWERLDDLATDPVLPHQTFTFFLHRSQHYRNVSSEAMRRCSGL